MEKKITKDIKEAVFKYDDLKDKTMCRWPIPENAPRNKAYYEGILWAFEYIRKNGLL